MFAIMKSNVAVTVLLFLGCTLTSAQPQSPEMGCANRLGEALTTLGPDFCDEYEEYVKCVLRERNLHILGIDRDFLRGLQEEIDVSMTSLPVHCEVDIFVLVREVRAEDLANAVAYNVSHIYAQGVTEFDDATDIGECTNAYVYHVTNAGAITCEDTIAYTKCVVRTLALHIFELTEEQLDDYEKDLNATLDLLGLDECVIDSQQILDNLRMMYNMAANFTTTTLSPIGGNTGSSAGRDIDSATTPHECYLSFLDLIGEGAITCPHFQAFMRCFVRVLTLENGEPISEAMKAVLQQNFDELYSFSNLTDCDTDIQIFIDEAAALLEVNTTSPFETATDTSGCTNALIEKVSSGQLTCEDATGFVTCIARVLNLADSDVSEKTLETLEEQLERQWALLGLQCPIDLEDILEELSGGTVQQVTSEPEPVSPEPEPVSPEPTNYDFDTATDTAGCSNALFEKVGAGQISCDVAVGFVTCIARVYNLAEADVSDELLESLERNLEQQWSILGIQCEVDLKEIIEELSGRTVPQVTTEPLPVSSSPEPVSSSPEPVSSSPEPVSPEPTNYACVPDDSEGCSNMVNGDYPACSSQCQEGVFVTCSNGYRYLNYCPDGWYRSPRGNPTTARLVFDPATGTCEYSTPHCPRPMDAFVLDQDS